MEGGRARISVGVDCGVKWGGGANGGGNGGGAKCRERGRMGDYGVEVGMGRVEDGAG